MNNQVRAVLFMLFAVASAGLLMRSWSWAADLPITFYNMRQAHSHMAFLGWIFPAVMLLYNRLFAPTLNRSVDRFLFWVIIVINILMFASFLQFGYTSPSIILLSIHTILAFVYAGQFLRNLSANIPKGARLLAISSMVMMCISFLGPLAIPVIKNTGGGANEMKLAIHFYLHFQYNAFFVLAMLALWARNVKQLTSVVPLVLMWLGMCGTYFLTVKDGLNSELLITVGAGAAILQLVGMFWLVKMMWKQERGVSGILRFLPAIAIGSILLKCSIQAVSNWIPELTVGDGLQFWVIAFLHLMFLGAITPYLLFEFAKEKMFPATTLTQVSVVLFVIGLVLTELVLGLQGLAVYIDDLNSALLQHLLLFGSLFIWISCATLLLGSFLLNGKRS